MLALQRAAGNAATARVLARRRPAPPPVLRILMVPGNATGLSSTARTTAIQTMRAELARVTRASSVAAVRRGVRVEEAASAPSGHDEHTLVVYFVNGPDGDLALRLAQRHITIPAGQQNELRTHMARQLAASGGATMTIDGRSVCFVATTTFEAVQSSTTQHLRGRERTQMERAIGLRMAEIALHEVGHALGAGHEAEGLMVGVRQTELTRPRAERFSGESAADIRASLEGLAEGRLPQAHRH